MRILSAAPDGDCAGGVALPLKPLPRCNGARAGFLARPLACSERLLHSPGAYNLKSNANSPSTRGTFVMFDRQIR